MILLVIPCLTTIWPPRFVFFAYLLKLSLLQYGRKKVIPIWCKWCTYIIEYLKFPILFNSDFQASNVLGKASKLGSGLFSKLKSGINDLTESTLSYAEQKGWDQQLRSQVGINLPRAGPKHSQFLVLPFNIDFSPPLYIPHSPSSQFVIPFLNKNTGTTGRGVNGASRVP